MIWKEISIQAGFESDMQDVLTGYITYIKPCFDPDPSKSILEIRGKDKSVLMDRQEILMAWPDKKDSDIASEIFEIYGFTPEVEDTQVVHEEAVYTSIQRETDLDFLERLARRNGFECFIDCDTAYFRKPKLDENPPQPVLACHFGKETSVNCFSVEVNSSSAANVSMLQVDPINKEEMESTVDASQQDALGETDVNGFTAPGIPPAVTYIGMSPAATQAEMDIMCQSVYHQGDWFVSARGQIAGNLYKHVLKPRRTVTIKGIGKTYSGVYYVSHVTHSFTPDGYVQDFKAKRNALMPTGSEEFSASSELPG
jgi:phage protein D